jgi:hypothetical protein
LLPTATSTKALPPPAQLPLVSAVNSARRPRRRSFAVVSKVAVLGVLALIIALENNTDALHPPGDRVTPTPGGCGTGVKRGVHAASAQMKGSSKYCLGLREADRQ